MAITFADFGSTLVPLAKRLGRSVSCDTTDGTNRSWGIACSATEPWPRLSHHLGWETATLHTGPMQCEWVDDISDAIRHLVGS